MTITLLGATGKAGTLVARGLLAEGQRVRALVRDQARPATGSAPIPGWRSSRATWARPPAWRPRSGVPTPPASRRDRPAWRGTSRASRSWQPGAPPCRSSSSCRC
jgi:nucleoside-diphosphate-sugar epimerase